MLSSDEPSMKEGDVSYRTPSEGKGLFGGRSGRVVILDLGKLESNGRTSQLRSWVPDGVFRKKALGR